MGLDVIQGQDHTVRFLRHLRRRADTSLSLLFQGPRGVGKRTAALQYARTMNCRETDENCGECNACRLFQRHADSGYAEPFPDFIYIDRGEKSISIDEIKTIISETDFYPFQMPYRTIIINHAHRLTTPAMNALLKVLEEPPPRNIFILISCSPDQILPTIRSRCLKATFHYLTPQITADLLRTHYDLTDKTIHDYLSFSPGSLQYVDEIQNTDILGLLHEFLRDHYPSGPDSRVVPFLEKVISQDIDTGRFLDYLTLFFTDMLKSTWDEHFLLGISAEYLSQINVPAERCLYCLDRIRTARDDLYINTNKALALESLMLDLSKESDHGTN